nr:DUF6240 domain-containing protein [Lachnospiraceae bacterium]
LKQELDGRQQEGDTPAEKYARFLYQLEKKNGISEEERESYIGIYRLFRTLKKTDHAAIGTVLNEGAEMTIGNLLSATRSMKTASRGIDAKIDDRFGGVDGKYRTPSISAQIETAFRYYSLQADSVYEHMSIDGLVAAQPTEDTLLPELAEAMAAAEETADGESAESKAYAGVRARQIRESLAGEEAERAAMELERNEIPVTPNYVEAMRALRQGRRKTDSIWDSLARLSSRSADAATVRDAMTAVEEALGEGARFEEIYQDKTQEMIEDLDRMMEDTGTTIDLQMMLLTKRQLSVATRQADRGSYDIPVEVDGEQVNLHVTIREADGNGSLMSASVPTTEHGVLTLSLSVKEGRLSGVLNTSEAQAVAENYVKALRTRFGRAAEAVTGEEAAEDRISLIYQAGEDRELQAAPGDKMEGELCFKLAHAFVLAVSGS